MTDSIFDTIKKTVFIPPHPAGIPFIGGGLIAALLFFLISDVLGLIAVVFTLFCLYFFRDPDRIVPQKNSLVLSGGDGTISHVVENVVLPPEIKENDTDSYTRISTFLSVLNVHVNRIPISGKIIRKVYTPGKFLNADLDKASEDNERCALLIETEGGQKIAVVQIAGLVARRILNDVKEGDVVTAGSRFGIIRFGSRVDIYIPQGISPLVCVGQTMIGGETPIADLMIKNDHRTGKTD